MYIIQYDQRADGRVYKKLNPRAADSYAWVLLSLSTRHGPLISTQDVRTTGGAILF